MLSDCEVVPRFSNYLFICSFFILSNRNEQALDKFTKLGDSYLPF